MLWCGVRFYCILDCLDVIFMHHHLYLATFEHINGHWACSLNDSLDHLLHIKKRKIKNGEKRNHKKQPAQAILINFIERMQFLLERNNGSTIHRRGSSISLCIMNAHVCEWHPDDINIIYHAMQFARSTHSEMQKSREKLQSNWFGTDSWKSQRIEKKNWEVRRRWNALDSGRKQTIRFSADAAISKIVRNFPTIPARDIHDFCSIHFWNFLANRNETQLTRCLYLTTMQIQNSVAA